jgi:hypothetical protein
LNSSPSDTVGPGGLRLGLSMSQSAVDAVLIDEHDRVIVTATGTGPERLSIACQQALANIDPSRIRLVAVATTQLSDWLNQSPMTHVGVLRLGSNADTAVPPFAGWPTEFSRLIAGPTLTVAGGVDTDGLTLGELDLDAVEAFANECAGTVSAVAISASFSLLDATPERAAAAAIRTVLGPEVVLSLSHRVGGFGLLERENATILTAALASSTRALLESIEAELATHDVDCDLFVAQNDGTLLVAAAASELPLRLIAGRLASAIRGAGTLAKVQESIVVDRIGDQVAAGVLHNGLVVMERRPLIRGVRINQDVPLGFTGAFTASDLIIDHLRRHAGDVPILNLDSFPFDTIDRVRGSIASAVGAATAPVSTRLWGYALAPDDHSSQLSELCARAIDETILAGADPVDTRVCTISETNVTYKRGETLRLSVQAMGRPFYPNVDSLDVHEERKHYEEPETPDLSSDHQFGGIGADRMYRS